jgi:hypothetical protein
MVTLCHVFGRADYSGQHWQLETSMLKMAAAKPIGRFNPRNTRAKDFARELTGKRLNLRLVQRVGAAGKPLPDVEIVEIKAIIVLVLV